MKKCSMQKKIESLSKKKKSEGVADELKGIDIKKGSILEDVVDWAEYEVSEGYDSIKEVLETLMDKGVLSGMTFLTYTDDGVKFFNEHKEEINEILGEYVYNINGAPFTYEGWDEEDPLALNPGNQFCLSAFAFEEVARDLLDKIGG